MNKIPLYATMVALSCGAALLAAAQGANAPSAPWRSLLKQDSAPDWRGWKEPGLPAGWGVAGGGPSKEGGGGRFVTQESAGNFELHRVWKVGWGWQRGNLLRCPPQIDRRVCGVPQ